MALFNRLWKEETGATFLELISMIVIIGVLSYFAFANLSNSNVSVKEQSLAKKILSDVRFAQEMAMSHGQLVQFVVETTENRYSLKWQDESYLQTPVAEEDFIVDIDEDFFVGTNISSTGFTSGTLQFGADGKPLDNGSLLTEATTLVELNGATIVCVEPETGRCYVQ